MSAKFLKTIVPLILAVVIVLSGCSSMKVNTGAEDIREIGDQIAGYSLPQGYSEQFGVDLLGYQLVSLQGASPSCHIYLVQAPKDAEDGAAELEAKARSMAGEGNKNETRYVQIVETRTVTIRGQEAPLTVGEGVNSEKEHYREISVFFEGRSGPALLSISSPAAEWDWDLVDAFIASIE